MAPSTHPDRWKRLEQLFQQALDLDPQERPRFLDEACGQDSELRQEVESLLESAGQASDFIEKPLQQAALQLSASRSALAPGSRFGHYEIVSQVGAGGMGRVYLALDGKLGRKVALKTLTLESVHGEQGLLRLEREARTASALNHPNILTIYEVGQFEGIHFIAAEFVDGPNLRQKLETGRIAAPEAIEIAIQIAAGLNAAHSVGIVHRDIKPENVMLRDDGLVKVVDFGIAKPGELLRGDSQDSGVPLLATQPGMVVGTARYMSPEQVRGLPVDGRTDIFSLGTVLYEMVAGKTPFQGATHCDVFAEILKTDPAPLNQVVPETPPQLSAIISKAMCKEREGRYQSAGEMLAALQMVQKDLELKRGRRLAAPIPWIAAALFVLAMAIGSYLAWRNKTPTPAAPRTLAILPFRNIRQDAATDFLGFSLADAVITKLGYVSSLTVRPSSSIDRYRNQTIDPRKVGAELNVNTLLTGSFLKDGEDIRINAQLVDLQPLRMIWEDTIDIKYENLLTVQDRVSQKIITGLELSLAPVEGERLKSDSTVSRSAYERYLRGVDLYATNDFENAIQTLEQSATMDPNYALTWAHLGRAYTTNAGLQFGGREQYRKAQAAYEKALRLNPDLIETKVYMANLLTDTGRADQAVPLLRAALAANPNLAEAHWELGYAYRFGGLLPESVAECEHARQLDPKVKINSSAMNTYLYLGQYDKFLANLPGIDSVYILFYRGFGEYHKGDYTHAEERWDRAFEMNPSVLPAEVGKALALGLRHENAAGLKLLQETESRVRERGVTDGEGIYKVSQAYAVLGAAPSALRMLQLSIAGGFYPYPYFRTDPLLGGIRNEPRFAQLMEEARRKYEQFRARFGGSPDK